MSDVNVLFVCWGNICRSPIAERVTQKYLDDAGLDGVTVTSAGVSDEEHGAPMDRRARAVLEKHGYDAGHHRAHRITADEIADADLIVAAEPTHAEMIRDLAPEADVELFSDFDPDAEPGSGIPDPWYGGPEGFEDTLRAVEAAMPGVLDRVRALQGK
ncbi:low molecular weight protein-tyrosine-phosphatase [Nigerium massiliense]|uniref:low molecular weight protein-tyrosine-phosphatase n=1 Tax=Nigerium massiliense TaxID=1522317 RepID=UPI000693A257|nr:low molecular weight protein-tyrosine-phosphatase [Nigerium massiliense]